MGSPKVTWKTTPTFERISKTQIANENEQNTNSATNNLLDRWLSPNNNNPSSPLSKRQRAHLPPKVVTEDFTSCLNDESIFDDFFSNSSCNEGFDEIDWSEVPLDALDNNSSKSFTSAHCIVSVQRVQGEIHIETASRQQVYLRDSWADISLRTGDYFNLVSCVPLDCCSEIVVDGAMQILFVLQPSLLLTGTHVADSVSCTRRAVLSYLHWADPGATQSKQVLIVGHVLHEAFESCLASGNFGADFVEQQIAASVCRKTLQIFFLSVSLSRDCTELYKELLEECKEKSKSSFYLFYEKFVSTDFKVSHCLDDWNRRSSEQSNAIPSESVKESSSLLKEQTDKHVDLNSSVEKTGENEKSTHSNHNRQSKSFNCNTDAPGQFKIASVESIEESILSLTYGIKGNMDATVRDSLNFALMPFELKTGRKSSFSNHLAQTILYSLLLQDRYPEENVKEGLLFYLGTGELLRVCVERREIGSLLVARNRLASSITSFVLQNSPLPPKCDTPHTCKFCPFAVTCASYEKMDGEKDASFFSYWSSLVRGEEACSLQKKLETWNSSVSQRVKSGRCISELTLTKVESYSHEDERRLFQFQGSPLSIAECSFYAGDSVVLSTANVAAIMTGCIHGISPHSGCISVISGSKMPREHGEMFIMDLNEHCISHAFARSNLMSLFANSHWRRVICGNALQTPPSPSKHSFRTSNGSIAFPSCSNQENICNFSRDSKDNDDVPSVAYSCNSLVSNSLVSNSLVSNSLVNNSLVNTPKVNTSEVNSLNKDQENVLQRVSALNAETNPFLMVHGMPGTGKTTTIARVIEHLVLNEGKRVLLAGYTHIAIDMVLLKLNSNTSLRMLRLGGSAEKALPEIRHLCPPHGAFSSIEECASSFQNVNVVACTIIGGIMHSFVQTSELFDVCIVDEASQIILPLCLGPVLKAKTFVLVGDPMQLPPILAQTDAAMLDEFPILTLFDWLSLLYPNVICKLSIQYRMNEEIMQLSNNLFYQGQLKCASAKVQHQHYAAIPNTCGNVDLCWFCWLNTKRVAFIDTSGHCPEQRVADVLRNEGEARIVASLLIALCQCGGGISPAEIGFITPYKA